MFAPGPERVQGGAMQHRRRRVVGRVSV